jgi:acetylornithine deacetylase/succinyl-diaminopimelate desuccinylase-like protein
LEVRTLAGNLHSGAFGGAAPDPVAALARMIDSLYDEHGGTVVKGLPCDQDWSGVEYPEERFRADAKVLDGVRLIGTGQVAARLWARPAVTVLGIDIPSVVGSTSSVQAGVRAKISLRVPPGMDVKAAQDALIAHLESVAPWQVQLTITAGSVGSAFSARTTGPAYEALASAMREAFGTELVSAGEGGSIPLCSTLAGLYPEAEIVLMGVEEPTTQIHALNESLDPAELERMALGEALWLRDYAAGWGK